MKNIKKTKVLISPAHYYLDNQKSGGELNWVANILERIVKSKRYFFYIITGYSESIELDHSACRLYEIYRSKNNNLSIFNILYFMLKKTFKTRMLGRKNNFQLVHHILPFSIGTTFDLDFIFKNKNKKYLIGPIQSSQLVTFNDEYNFTMTNFTNVYSQRLMQKMNNFLVAIFQPLNNYLSNLTLKKADKIIVINEHTKKILLKRSLPSNKIIIIPPGVDIETFKYIPFEKKRAQIIEIITTGWLIKRKGVELIIKAISEVVKTNKNISLRIIGLGPQTETLKELVLKLNLQSFVIFEGFIPHHKIQNYYQRAHIFVSMSRSEGFATVCLEAMASGLAIISSKAGGFSGSIQNGVNGFLVAQEDYIDLSKKIIILLKNHDLISSFGKNARIEAEKHYDWEKVIIPKYLEVYKSSIIKIRDHEKYYYHNPSYSQMLANQDIDVFGKYVDSVRKYLFPKANFLEVGCGVGQVLGLLKDDNLNSYGVDVSESSIKKCRDKKLNCRWYDGKKLPFSNNYFDLVSSYNVFEHTNDPEKFLAEQLRVLKKGGYLIIACPNFLSMTNNYHYHTKGIIQKMRNLAAIIRRSVYRKYIFIKMRTVKKDNFCPDDDACNVTNPQDLLKWAEAHKLKLIYWSSQPVYKKGLSNFLDFSFFRIFFGSLFMIFKKR